MDPHLLNVTVLVAAGMLVTGVVAVRLAWRSRLPSLLLYLLIGLFFGEAGLGLRFDDVDLTRTIATLLLALILVEGGFNTRWSSVRPVVARSAVLATGGVLVTIAATTVVCHGILGLDLRTSVILGSVASSTDAAATFSIMRRVPVRPTTRTTLEAESGFNDPPAIVAVSVVTSDAWFAPSPLWMAGISLYQLGVGAAVGIAVGWVGAWLLRRSALPVSGLYPLAFLSLAGVSFAVGGLVGASGLMACYVTGLWLGNSTLPHMRTTRGFTDSAAWVAQMGLFIMLGLLSSPARLPEALPTALLVAGVLLVLARPIAVAVCLLPFRVPWREQVFISWAGLRGAVPIVLSTMPLTMGLPDAHRIFDIIFLLVLASTLVQGPLLPLVGLWTGVLLPQTDTELDFESAPLEEAAVSVLKFGVPPSSRLAGLYVRDLMLPPKSNVAMVVREGEVLVPDLHTRVRPHDGLVVACPTAAVGDVQERLRDISRGGRLVRWHDS